MAKWEGKHETSYQYFFFMLTLRFLREGGPSNWKQVKSGQEIVPPGNRIRIFPNDPSFGEAD
jgi:hypothetical protein